MNLDNVDVLYSKDGNVCRPAQKIKPQQHVFFPKTLFSFSMYTPWNGNCGFLIKTQDF